MPDWRVEVAEINDAAKAADEAAEVERGNKAVTNIAHQVALFNAELRRSEVDSELSDRLTEAMLRLMMGRQM